MKKLQKSKMKLSDYIRLGRLSIKARKKSTKNTVFGMAFGLILLVPMIFFALAFYTDMSKKVNSIEVASELNIALKNINDDTPSTAYKEWSSAEEGRDGMPAYSYYDDLIDYEEVSDYILSEYANMSFVDYQDEQKPMKLNIMDGDDIENSITIGSNGNPNSADTMRGRNQLKIIFPELSTETLFTEAELNDYKKMTGKTNPLDRTCNLGFTEATKGKNEIIISESLLELWGVDKEDVAGKNIQILYPKIRMGDWYPGGQIDNDTNPNNDIPPVDQADPEYQLYFCYNYKVVGIIKDDFYEMPGKADEAHMWVTAASVYYEEGKEDYVQIPYQINRDEENRTTLTFGENIADIVELNVDDQYMLLMQGLVNRYNEIWNNNTTTYELNKMILTMQVKEYSLLKPLLVEMKELLKSAYSEMSPDMFNQAICNEVYTQFYMIDQIGKLLIIVFSTIGGIIFFTNMLNLLNTIRYSVESRKNYIGVMRAIGAKSRVIPRLYIFEMLIIFVKTFIRVGIFATLLSIGIKLGIDKGFEYISAIVEFKINFIYYPVALGGAIVLTTIIGTFFARISSRITAYQPILKTLFDEK